MDHSWSIDWNWVIVYNNIFCSPHPCAGHTIAEHYEFQHRLETYDYIGIVNFFNINVGYHVEHHDFPMVPWTRLPLIRKMAPEFYENLPYHTSYVKVFMT
jgi:sphingolipid delta-4 desaturase